MVLSSLAEIVGYIDSPPSNKWNEWVLLSAVQREIDMRYAVVPTRHVSSFIDLAGIKSQTVQEALECIQKEMYELAPYFLNLSTDYSQIEFYGFPQYYSKRTLNLDEDHTIERLIVEGSVPNESGNGSFSTVSAYNTFLKNVCFWLEKYRYRNACPYTFTLSTYTRDWEFLQEDNQLCIDQTDTSPDNRTWDIWQMENENTGDLRRKQWDKDVGISADNNGQKYSGIQIEVFQWFRFRNLNNPDLGEEYNGYPASDNVVNAEGMPYGKEPPWKTIDPSELTAEWSQYEWELNDPSVMPRHIPYDLSDWTCKTRLSTVETGQWEALEKGWESGLSAQWAAQLSAGWDKVMTSLQQSQWGTVYLSCFPVTGLTGKIVGIPVLSASPEASRDFFPDTGHEMHYSLNIDHKSEIYEEWNPDPWDDNRKIDTKQRETLHITMHKEHMPFEVTMENPTAYEADGYVVFYPPYLAHSLDPHVLTERTIDETHKFRQNSPAVPIWERDLLVEEVVHYTATTGISSYNSFSYRVNTPTTYQTEEIHNYEFEWRDSVDTRRDVGTQKRWNLKHNDYFLVDEWDLSSGVPYIETAYYENVPYYSDTFGLYQPSEGQDEGTSMKFLPIKTFDPYSYETIWSHLSDDTPPIDFDMESIAAKELEGPYYPGIDNTVSFHQTSDMRIYTFFDFSKSFNLDKELD